MAVKLVISRYATTGGCAELMDDENGLILIVTSKTKGRKALKNAAIKKLRALCDKWETNDAR
jgi:hypothetical protein